MRVFTTGVQFLVISAFCVSGAPELNAQSTVAQLLQNSVETIDDRYKDVEDAIGMFRRNNASAALGLLKKARAAHPHLPPAEVLYAHLCFGASQADAGRAILELAAVRYEDDPEPWTMLADLAMRAGRLAEADVLFQRALSKAGEMAVSGKRKSFLLVSSHAGLARVDERRGLWARAEKHLEHWMELQPNNVGALQRLAAACFSQQKFEDASQTLQLVREIDDRQPLPEVVMGVLHQKTGQQEESEKMMRLALEKAPDDLVTRMAIAEWALTSGRTDMASENAKAVLKLDSDSARAKLLLGRVKRYEGKAAEAEAVFREIYDQSPASFAASNELALALFAQDDADKHNQALQYAQVNATRYKDPRTVRGREAAATFAYGLLKLKQEAAAEKVIQQVITSGEVSPQIGYFAAMIYRSRGRMDIAQQLLERSLASYISFPERESAKELSKTLSAAVEQQKKAAQESPVP